METLSVLRIAERFDGIDEVRQVFNFIERTDGRVEVVDGHFRILPGLAGLPARGHVVESFLFVVAYGFQFAPDTFGFRLQFFDLDFQRFEALPLRMDDLSPPVVHVRSPHDSGAGCPVTRGVMKPRLPKDLHDEDK
ncbi:hypothetical protein VSR68_32855 [Paraburkholderia phymatum]|uniref:hypothetical protein n=1 Tax=Paraburkholderia phymatum TaxID=148447 RepID=UPI0031794A6B